MASRMKGFELSQLIAVFLIISSFRWQEHQTEASHGYDASFTKERLPRYTATVDETAEHHSRRRRDADPNCVIQDVQAKLDEHSHDHHFNDSNFSLMLVWTGQNGKELLALSTMEVFFFAAQSKLWISEFCESIKLELGSSQKIQTVSFDGQSTDFGDTFTDINHRIDGAIIKKNGGLFKSPLDPKKLILISYSDDMDKSRTKMYITKNAGNSFKKVMTPFYLDSPLEFHPTKSDWILAHATYQDFKVFLSKDFGITWKSIRSNVVDFSWGTKAMNDQLIFLVTDDVDPSTDENPHEGEYKLLRSRDAGRSFETIRDRMFNYGLQDKFVYVAIADKKDPENRILEVSINQGSSWNSTHLPVITKDRFFSILDMNEGMVFLHVDDPGNTGAGTIYTSDADGIIFSKSLEKHLFPNGDTITDFYRMISMRGVYFASQIADDASIHTMVTFDRGGIWSSVKPPTGMKCKNSQTKCSLQIHNQYSRAKGVGLPMGPLSVKNAQGLVLAHAHVSDALEVSAPDVYVSSDGGYNWSQALKGPHHYAITNYGALILAVPAGLATKKVLFSYDEGHCWNEYEFSKEDVMVTGILPEPLSKSLNVSIWGFGEDDSRWRVFTIDFSAVLDKKCEQSDYVKWVPHSDNEREGCLLGFRETFEKVKPDSVCQIDINYERPKKTNHCECTKADYECDFGYQRENDDEDCMVSPEYANRELDICINGKEEEIVTKGYRKIPGDVCDGGFQPTRDVDTLKKKCHEQGINLASSQGHKSRAAGVVIFLIVLVLACGVLFLLYRDKKLPCLRRSNASYSYRALSQSDELDKIIDLDSKDHTYHDSSDDDMIE